MRFNAFYGHAKQCSSELRPGIKAVEETVKSVLGPVHEKFRLVPDEILRHVNIDHAEHRSTNNAPVANVATVSKMTVRLYDKCEPVVEQSVASAWKKVKQSPMFHRVANAAAQKATYYRVKYNESVIGAAEKGYKVSAYLPSLHSYEARTHKGHGRRTQTRRHG